MSDPWDSNGIFIRRRTSRSWRRRRFQPCRLGHPVDSEMAGDLWSIQHDSTITSQKSIKIAEKIEDN